jgi:5-methylcytosine-specific restriction endonuclease McrA
MEKLSFKKEESCSIRICTFISVAKFNIFDCMPPSAVKTVRDLIFWQYAKIISESAGMGKKNWRFVMRKFWQLKEGEIFWNEIREYVKEKERKDECIFCGKKNDLTIDHLLPRSLGGPNDEKNVVFVCGECNSSKGSRRLYEFWTIRRGLEGAKYEVPRIAEGKYLKFVYEVLEENVLLDLDLNKIRKQICPECDVKFLCVKEKSVGKLSPLCLDGIVTLCFRGKNGMSQV